MSITSERIDYIIKVGIHPIPKQDRFLKSSRIFRRVCTNSTQTINVQGSWTNSDDKGQFTFDLAVYFPDAANNSWLVSNYRSSISIRPHDKQRIGRLTPVHRDYWWKYDSKSDLNNIAKEVASPCEDHSTVEGALQFLLLRKKPYWTSIFSMLLENRENAEKYLKEAISKASQNPSHKSH